jgi:hypothetical protein
MVISSDFVFDADTVLLTPQKSLEITIQLYVDMITIILLIT